MVGCTPRGRQHARRRLLVAATILLALLASVTASASSSATAPPAARRHTLYLEELPPSLDERDAPPPTLVSVREVVTFPLPAGSRVSVEGDRAGTANTHEVTLQEEMDPLWFFSLRQRGFQSMEWSGCGGNWRPEWSSGPAAKSGDIKDDGDDDVIAREFAQLRHRLSQHVVCAFSSVSFCAGSRERSPARQFQWAAQLISTLTSSPLSWTDETPRHIRPDGFLVEEPAADADGQKHWCSYHLAHHDVLCTQHVNPLLRAGRSGTGVQEGLPEGVFGATMDAYTRLFATPYHHFRLLATQQLAPGGTHVELRVEMQLSFVVHDEDVTFLAKRWRDTLPPLTRGASPLRVYVGPGGIRPRLLKALPAAAVKQLRPAVGAGDPTKAGGSDDAASAPLALPEARYRVQSHGKDHGYFELFLVPAAVAAPSGSDDGASATAGAPKLARPTLKEGDVVRTLLTFPLHLLRPVLHSMESLLGETVLEGAVHDQSANTLALTLRTVLSATHVKLFHGEMALRTRDGAPAPAPGLLLARLRFAYGWTALKDMARDANSHRVVPQPVLLLERAASGSATDSGVAGDAARHCGAVVDHQVSIARIMRAMTTNSTEGPQQPAAAAAAAPSCIFWLRAVNVAGSTVPAPDPAMVFNVLSLGLVFMTMATGSLSRMTQRLVCSAEDAEEAFTSSWGEKDVAVALVARRAEEMAAAARTTATTAAGAAVAS